MCTQVRFDSSKRRDSAFLCWQTHAAVYVVVVVVVVLSAVVVVEFGVSVVCVG